MKMWELRKNNTSGFIGKLSVLSEWADRVSARSNTWGYGRSLARTVGSSSAADMNVCVTTCCGLSGRGFCVEFITRPEESYRVWCVWVWS